MSDICIGLILTFAYVAIAMLSMFLAKKNLANNSKCTEDECASNAMMLGVFWPLALLIVAICVPLAYIFDFIYGSLEKDN